MKKALITGGSGYFGSLLVQKLRSKGFSCVILDLNDSSDREADVEFMQGDIRDLDLVKKSTQGIDVVFHNVAQVPLAKNVDLFDSVNVQGTSNILTAAYESGVSKLIYTSSSAVFGIPKANPVTEFTLPQPGEKYGEAKYKGELLCHEFTKKGLDVSIIRPRTIMGHGRLGIFQILFEWIREGYNVPVLGKGDNLYQFVHADDLADACILASMRSGSEIYNCGTNRFGSMREVLTALCEYANTGSKVKSIPMTPAVIGMRITSALGLSPLGDYHSLMYGRSMYFDTSKAENELSWSPKYSNAEMFIESYKWYLDNRESIISNSNASHHRSAVKQGILGVVKWLI